MATASAPAVISNGIVHSGHDRTVPAAGSSAGDQSVDDAALAAALHSAEVDLSNDASAALALSMSDEPMGSHTGGVQHSNGDGDSKDHANSPTAAAAAAAGPVPSAPCPCGSGKKYRKCCRDKQGGVKVHVPLDPFDSYEMWLDTLRSP